MLLDKFKEQYDDVSIVLELLHLSDDIALRDKMALVKIELEAAMYKLPETTTEVRVHLNRIHFEQLNSSLYRVLESALGYYALIDQVKGSNEPLIGPSFARELLTKLRDSNLDLPSLKDELHILIGKA
ncbi:MAG: hypothetical protein JKY88_16225 [Pseudomonadales bacterium]|nr:hypothetical protein [Pseudomonadales bacterium]